MARHGRQPTKSPSIEAATRGLKDAERRRTLWLQLTDVPPDLEQVVAEGDGLLATLAESWRDVLWEYRRAKPRFDRIQDASRRGQDAYRRMAELEAEVRSFIATAT